MLNYSYYVHIQNMYVCICTYYPYLYYPLMSPLSTPPTVTLDPQQWNHNAPSISESSRCVCVCVCVCVHACVCVCTRVHVCMCVNTTTTIYI